MKKVLKVLAVVLFVALTFTFAACAPASTDAAKAKMEKADYSVVVSTRSEVGENGEVASIVCTKKSDGNILSQIGSALDDNLSGTLYDTTAHAKAAFESTQNAEGKTNYTLVGKWVVYGSEAAVKAFKK